MKISELWLREWVNPPLTGQQLAQQLTMAGLEVDGVSPVAGAFSRVVVAKVLRTSAHPSADKLTLCEVDAGLEQVLKVVCGASNVRADLLVALALPGATLPGDIHIKESMLRGQVSQGMLCSASELGLEALSDGIIELALDAPIGCNLREYLLLNDQVFELDLTPNRADCFSLLGVAREVAVLNKLPFQEPQSEVISATITDELTVHIHAPVACPHYCGRVIRSINPHAITPTWMQERLRRSGLRVLHPVVDVMNYVMVELGQPMHAFDLQRITGDIHVRLSEPNETLTLLDNQDITLQEQLLVIADSEKAQALAGVMGSAYSAVHAGTTDVFLESAYFNPLIISGVARRYGLSSEASMRYERGVDPTLQVRALERATQLLVDIVGGHVGPITELTQQDHLPSAVTILFHPATVKRLTGLDISEREMKSMLQGLGMQVECASECWRVHVPPYRFDIGLDVDLVEEIARLYGFDNIQSQPTLASLKSGTTNTREQITAQMSSFLRDRGYHETINYSFVDPELQSVVYPKSDVMTLLNPISSELSDMRVGLWPGLIAAMLYNAHRQQTAIKLFEAGVGFERHKNKPVERACIAGLLTGAVGSLNWSTPARTFDFFDMKGDLQALFATLLKQDISFMAASHDALHPGQSARIMMQACAIGWIGVLHPRISSALDFHEDIVLFELTLNNLPVDENKQFQKISKYPQIRRDLSLLVNSNVTAGQIEGVVRQEVAPQLLKAFDVFDVYTGESIPKGKKSLAIALTLQDDNRTLMDMEINAIVDAIIIKLDQEFAITLRE